MVMCCNTVDGVGSTDLEDLATTDDDVPQDLSVSRGVQKVVTPESIVQESVVETGTDADNDSERRALMADGLSPLQRMQCIANSLPATTVTQSVAGASSSGRQLLPSITAEQMAACEEMNTDDVVAKVRLVCLSAKSVSE